MIRARLATIVVLVPAFLSLLFYSNHLVWSVTAAVFVMGGMWEWTRLAGVQRLSFRCYAVLFTGLTMLWAHLFLTLAGFYLWMAFAVGLWGIAIPKCLFYDGKKPEWAVTWWMLLLGVLALLPAWSALVVLKNMPNGNQWLLSMLLIVWMTDTGAFITGKLFGKKKFAPDVSPNKTWMGVFGGLTFATLTGLGLYFVMHPDIALAPWLFICTLSSMFGILGDLFESLLKRIAGIKDSGSIFPGHGGVLDRIDSILAAAPVFTLSLLYLMKQL